ncbi:MAG: restriction endonuclease subunit S, partial [Pseudanabaena sp.]
AFAIIYPFANIESKYIYYYLRSITFIRYVESQMKGMAYPAINDSNFFKGLFPLPPLAEQKAIVEKVDKLMDIIDQLEQQIKHRKQLAENLMQTVLREAFE